MVAAMVEHCVGVVCLDTPWSIEDIVGEPSYTWPVDVFLPRVLERLDLRPLTDAVAPVLMIRPRGPQGELLREESDGAAAAWVHKRLGL
jgi:hypothetical protein